MGRFFFECFNAGSHGPLSCAVSDGASDAVHNAFAHSVLFCSLVAFVLSSLIFNKLTVLCLNIISLCLF